MNTPARYLLVAVLPMLDACMQSSNPDAAVQGPPSSQVAYGLAPRVVGGVPSGSADDFAVRVGGCSGALVAPRIVVTARHCVAQMNPRATDARCHVQNAYDPISELAPGDLLPAGDLSIAVGPAAVARTDVHVLAIDVDTSGDASGCWRDVAVLTLDTALALPIVPLRSTAVAPGERVRLVGYGNVDDQGTPAPGRRTRADLEVLDVGETTFVAPDGERHVLLDDNLLTTSAACGGDSGGPVLDASGDLVGLTHRGLGDCKDGLNIYSGLRRLKPLLARATARLAPTAAEDAGAPPADAAATAERPVDGGATGDASVAEGRRADAPSACGMRADRSGPQWVVLLLVAGLLTRRARHKA